MFLMKQQINIIILSDLIQKSDSIQLKPGQDLTSDAHDLKSISDELLRARLGMFIYMLYTQACTCIFMNIRDKIINE